MKLRPELQSQLKAEELLWGSFRKKSFFCLHSKLTEIYHCWPIHKYLKARNHQRLLVPFLRLCGRESPLCSH